LGGGVEPIPASLAEDVADVATRIVGVLEEGFVGLDEGFEQIQGERLAAPS